MSEPTLAWGKRLLFVSAVSLTLAACSRPDQGASASYGDRVCTDNAGRRVPDDNCARPTTAGSNPFLWYYLGTLNRSGNVPLGGYVSGGSFGPARGVTYGPLGSAARAASVSRGGFGSIGAGHGGGGE